ncbi:BSD domain-containing protein C22A12.14c-like protein [Emericellopsis cladophorae]|uniref:BSD domain-containing protein C22A12.14c-like protein n=1 Tax=Emericellopsis cladophorae TaxID=2686198 RepID=A0A9P9Y0E7_9HYPO|nr:BSD domain-containing protein C22A12.14c-like protein [Emericellopsis cladophorae]KAI6781006.1 BSD domain-containing protein C22A12.14c-like protein [Emericellopsis cladophorae]
MDLAYDHLQDRGYARKEGEGEGGSSDDAHPTQTQQNLNTEIQDAYKAFTNSPWGSKIGGFFGTVVKQGESVYTQASKELAEVREEAGKGINDLRQNITQQTRGLTLHDVLEISKQEPSNEAESSRARDAEKATGEASSAGQPSESMLERLRSEAAKRLRDLQKAEDAADEALLRFGGNVRDFLRDAVSIAPTDASSQDTTVLFESKDAKGKRVIHTSRFDAQLHVIHTSTEGFTKAPTGPEYEEWAKGFDVEKKTGDIASDLDKYPDLRSTMERLVPDQIPYASFWQRYYFLRHGIETAETRRRDLLKAAAEEDEVGWGDDSDDEDEEEDKTASKKPASVRSSSTIQPPAPPAPPAQSTLKPTESRKSNDEKSQADSEASYDVVGAASGKTSRAPNSPKDTAAKKADESDDDDWE